MENFTLAELGVFLGVLGGVLTSLILTIQKSKCETINCCKRRPELNNNPPDIIPENIPPENNPPVNP